jgi:hypothetical protein
MKLREFLGRLDKLQRTGEGRWIACCPAHSDKSPSMSIKATPETVLIHCFAGCSAEEVLGAVGMTFSDLYPGHREHVRPQKLSSHDALRCVSHEALVAVATMGTMRQRLLTAEEQARLSLASGRIQAAMDMAGVRL